MRRDELAARLEERVEGPDVYPDYKEYSVANVPDTALAALHADARRPIPDAFDGVETDVDHVIVVLADGLGWGQFKRAQGDSELLSAFAEHGTVTPLTSVYPSETAAAMTTLHTGKQPAEHGLLGWYQFLPGYGGVVESLPFRTLDGRHAGSALGADADSLVEPGTTVYERAGSEGLATRVIQPEHTRGSVYTERVTRGAESVGYTNERDFADALGRTVADADHPTYALAYAPDVDGAGHEAGTDSPEHHNAVMRISNAVRNAVSGLSREQAERTLLVVTADHGQVNTDPEENIALGTDLTNRLRRPAMGGPRNLQLHTKDGERPDAEAVIESFDAATFTREESRDWNLFGDRNIGELFRQREPDLVCAPREVSMWYDSDELDLIGAHGGLHPDEMLVPFAACRVAELGL